MTTLTLARPDDEALFETPDTPEAALTPAEQMAVLSDAVVQDAAPDGAAFEARARLILSAMDAAGQGREAAATTTTTGFAERRVTTGAASERVRRVRFHSQASLSLFADPRDAEPWPLFLRDVEARAAGFICPDRMPLGYGGTLQFTAPDGRTLNVDVTLVRCRVCYDGWYEGALYFHRNQPGLLSALKQDNR